MTADEIITRFELQVSDVTELSSEEELDILDEVYQDTCAEMPWEFLKVAASGTIQQSGGVWYVTLPSDFSMMSPNRNYTDNSISNDHDAAPIVVFVGSAIKPYQVVNFSDRFQYQNQDGYCYIDQASGRIVFTYQPSDSTYAFDYIKVPAKMTLTDSPIFPARFHKMLAFKMAVNDQVLQLSADASQSEQKNQAQYDAQLAKMQYWNANQIFN